MGVFPLKLKNNLVYKYTILSIDTHKRKQPIIHLFSRYIPSINILVSFTSKILLHCKKNLLHGELYLFCQAMYRRIDYMKL